MLKFQRVAGIARTIVVVRRRVIFDILDHKMTSKEEIIVTLQSAKPQFAKLGVKNIGLFGSYLRGDQSEKSDIDLLLDFYPDKENFDNYMAAYDMLEGLFRNEKVEVVTKNGLSRHIGPNSAKCNVCLNLPSSM